jgi:hypothetical protein
MIRYSQSELALSVTLVLHFHAAVTLCALNE